MTRLKKLFAVLALNALVISFFSCKNNDEGPTYTISYEDGRTVISSQEIPINETVTVKSQSELGYPMKDTEMITGWMYCPYNEMSSVGSTGDVREPGSTFKATTNVRLCAKWYKKLATKNNSLQNQEHIILYSEVLTK